MFDDLIKQMKALEKNQEIKFTIEADEEGYYDKECPSSDCMFGFKVHSDDWAEKFQDEGVYCPFCGLCKPSDSWWTTEQIENAKTQALNQIKSKIGKALETGAKRFNQKQKKGFITIKMSVRGRAPEKALLPISAKDVMVQKVECEKCSARYSFVGTTFFCPCCGNNSVERNFDSAMENINNSINNLPTIVSSLEKEGLKDEAESIKRKIIESSISDCVTAFQVFCERFARKVDPSIDLRKNGFQSLFYGDEVWQKVKGKGYSDWLSKQEYQELNSLFQKRHLLEHKDGIIDQEYLDKSGDQTKSIGQRIVVKETDVTRMASFITRLSVEIKK